MKLPSRCRGAGVLAVVGGLCLALLAGGCTVETPKAPSTNFVLSIPVANDSTRVEQLVADRGDYLQIDEATGGMKLRVTVPLGAGGNQPPPGGCDDGRTILGCAEVGDNLQVPSVSDEFGTELGVITFDDPQDLPAVDINLNDLISGVTIEAGSTIPVLPPVTLDAPAVPLTLPNIESLVVVSGGIAITVENHFPVAIEGLVLSLTDAGNGGVAIDDLNLGTIQPGQSAGGDLSLAGSISGDLELDIDGNIAGGSNIPVTEEPVLALVSALLPLEVTEARAKIPSQDFADRQVLEFPQDTPVRVTEAVIREGMMTLTVTNTIPVIMGVELTLPDLLDGSGNPRTFPIDSLSTGAARVVPFDLTNNSFRPADPLKMRVEYEARTFDSDSVVTIRSDGEILVKAEMENLIFERVEGVLDSVTLEIPPEEREVEFPSGLDNVNIGSAGVDVFLTTAVGFSASVDLLFEGTNEKGNTEVLRLREGFRKGSFASPATDTVSVDTGLTRFLNNLPTSIRVAPVVRVGDGRETREIERNHWVSVDSVVFRSAPRLTVLASTRIDPDPEDISFRDSELRDKIRSNFIDAFVITELESSIPVGVGVRLMVARTREAVYDTASSDFVRAIPRRDLPRFEVPAAPVDASGLSNGTSTNTVTIELDQDDVLDFILEDALPGRTDSLFSGVRVTLPQTDGEVEVRADDFVNIIAAMRLQLELNKDLVK